MSDDEEVIYKGSSLGLCNYLTDLGYADFETFEPGNLIKGEQFKLHNDSFVDTERVNSPKTSSNALEITDHDYSKLVSILSSQLLFKEDAHLIESMLHNKHVCSHKPNYVFHTSVVLTGVLTSAIVLRSKVSNLGFIHYIIPAGFTFLFSCYSSWKFYKEFNENRKDYILMTHISDLKKVCFNVLKLARFIKETEILSTCQVPVNDIGSVLYVPQSKHKCADTDVLPQWKTLPHLRKCLSDTVQEVLNMLTISVDSLKHSLFNRKLVENHLRDDQEPCRTSRDCCSVSLLDLKELTIKYLSVQSEYLKELGQAFIFSSTLLNDNITDRRSQTFYNDLVFEMLVNLHKKLSDISFKLMMQYNIHNITSTFKAVTNKASSRSHKTEVYELQNGVHNVFLLLYSALLRVRSLEDTLENLSEIGESLKMKDKLNSNVTDQLTVLKDDLTSTVRCYNVLCQQATLKKLVGITKQDETNGCNVEEVNIKETGIVVGTSDFTVNSPDEVFLSLSGINTSEETPATSSECADDWGLERKPTIPKSLLTELSQTLKSRKTDFIEREKYALKRKGLSDIENISSSGEDSEESEDSLSRKKDKNSFNYRMHVAAQDYSHSSDSDDEMDPFESGAYLTKLKISKKYQSEIYSDSDSSVVDVCPSKDIKCCESDIACKPNLSTYSLANLAASKSQMWRKCEEEHYSDGSES